MLQFLHLRECGAIHPHLVADRENLKRTYTIDISRKKDFARTKHGSVNALNFDSSDHRYLLAGFADSTISLYDMEKTIGMDRVEFKPLVEVTKSNTVKHHTHGVSSLSWYPFDTGMFVSGGFDKTVKIWDTNELAVVHSIFISEIVFNVAMSRWATTHNLVAVASADQKVQLVDLRLGYATHTLIGHREAVMSVAWRPGNEFHLASSSMDGTLKMWDIRRSGQLTAFNQHAHSVVRRDEKEPPLKRLKTSSQIAAKAHDGPITSIVFTTDGGKLLSTGTDNKLRMWDVDKAINTLVNYPGIRNNAKRGNQMTVSSNGRLLYHPSGNNIQVFEVLTGKLVNTLRGHFETVNACIYHPVIQELYSGGNDEHIICWSPTIDEIEEQKDNMDEGDGENDFWDSSAEE